MTYKTLYLLAEARYIDLGLNIDNVGFKYLCDATVLEFLSTYLSYRLDRAIYTEVADINRCSYHNVERDVRYALRSAYKKDIDRYLNALKSMCRNNDSEWLKAMSVIRIVARDIAVETEIGF